MGKRIILLVVISLVVLVLSGCTQNEFVKYQEQIEQDPYFCDTLNGEERDWCYAFAANIRADPELCNEIVSNDIIEECFEEVAPEINDPEKCKKLRTTDEKNSCYANVARFLRDISYCDEIVGENNYCFSTVGILTNNESLCKDSGCVSRIAVSKNDSELCRKIPEMELIPMPGEDVDRAVTYCFLGYAQEKKKQEMCFLFTDQEIANSCFMYIAVEAKDITLCKHLEDLSGIPKVTECTFVNGEKICKAKETFLDRTDEFKILNCYEPIAKDDPEQCDKVAEDSMKLRNECYYHISRLNNDPSICKNIVLPGIDNVTCESYLDYHKLVPTPET